MNNLDCAKAYIEDINNNYDDYSKNQILNSLNSALMFLNSVIVIEQDVALDSESSVDLEKVSIPGDEETFNDSDYW